MKPNKKVMPNPGTIAAEEMGCICPVMDNEHGRGYMGQKDIFVYTEGCPVHSNTTNKKEDKV